MKIVRANTIHTLSVLLSIGVWAGLLQGVSGQTATFPVGEVIDSVAVEGAGHESYALYLPTKFRESELSPLLVIFHPAAQGRYGITPFLEASEKYGFILICSNDSKNGPYDANYEISNRLFGAALRRFNVDPARIYTAGFSGGARLASSIAVLTGQIQGVVACGAGFTPNQLAAEPQFSYAAVIGNRDFNYSEMQKTAGWLIRLNAPNELFEYDMGHEWPTGEQLRPVFQWLWLEACRKGLVPPDEGETEAIYKQYLQEARESEKGGQWVRAATWYGRILRNFPERSARDHIAAYTEELKRADAYRSAMNIQRECLKTEETETARFYERFSRDLQKREPDIHWWEKALERLQTRAGTEDPYIKAMIARIRATLSAFAFEAVTHGTPSPAQRIFCYELIILTMPGQPFAYLALMDIYLDRGEAEQAFNYLEALLQSGFDAPDYLRAHPTVRQLRSHPGYGDVLGEER